MKAAYIWVLGCFFLAGCGGYATSSEVTPTVAVMDDACALAGSGNGMFLVACARADSCVENYVNPREKTLDQARRECESDGGGFSGGPCATTGVRSSCLVRLVDGGDPVPMAAYRFYSGADYRGECDKLGRHFHTSSVYCAR